MVLGSEGLVGCPPSLGLLARFDPGLGRRAAVAEAVGIVAGLHDVAVVGEAVEQGRGHLGIGEDTGPLCEGQVGGDHHAGVFVELGEQVKEQGPARLAERQVAELIEDDQIDPHQAQGQFAGAPLCLLLLQAIDQVHGGEETHPPPVLGNA